VGKLRVDFGNSANQKISIKNIRLTKPLTSETNVTLVKNQKEIRNYLNGKFSNQITAVSVGKDGITVKGTVNKPNLYLCELQMFDDPKNTYPAFASIAPIPQGTSFEIKKSRFISNGNSPYDRLYSRWIIAAKKGPQYQLESFAHYADDIRNIATQYLPEEKPESKKGLAGFIAAGNTTPDLKDLNIKNVTINVNLPTTVSLTPTAYSYNLNGKLVYFNTNVINGLDQTVKTCSNQNILVSAILLIPRGLSGEFKTAFVHPSSNAGVYSMANLTSLDGFNLYRACVAFLAERYSRPGKEYGRIHHWIVHNEVDNGYYWTNAGDLKIENYTELYDRSMRTVYYTVRQYNPSAKVFLSLTHFWNGSAAGIFYPPHNLLDIFNKLSNMQGDYEWGIAYHPYPENSFDPKSWNDPDITNDLKTTDYITPKNIELLDEWIRMKSHLYKGLKIRTLLFSEQGVHSVSYETEDLKVQAAGLAYMWKKFNRLPSLEAFDYHRADDDRSESGLLLGLWTVKAGTNSDPDKKKASWFVYQKAGTGEEDNFFSFALGVIGVKSWAEIFNPLKGETMPLEVTFKISQGNKPLDNVEVYFNEEMRRTINGTAKFYNVASGVNNRSYKLIKDAKILREESKIAITRSQTIAVDIH
jgi:hypothetical protein